MNVIFKPLNLQRKPIIYGIFACMFFYLVLRAIYVAPLLDELGTLIWYIQSGNILNDKAVLDANNHLLNSFVGHYLYLTFGDHLLVYRLLPILCFPIYFFSTKKLVERNIKSFQFLIFLALICIHWVFDYFGLSRGYAPSLAFFMLGLSMISHWNHAFKFRYLILILLCSLICILSNLSMIVPIILLYAYLMLTLLFRWRTVSRYQKIGVIFISMVYFSLLFVIYLHISKLKNANAFWWGSQQGLCEVTGKSLSKNVLYTESEIVKYGILLLIVILSLVFILKFLRGAKDFIYSLPFWAFSLFVLALLSAEVMVYALDVNYPQDRVAMYLVILLILSLGGLLSEIKGLKWLLLLLLWFPISFIGKVNLKSTIFSPEDRLSNSFFKEIQSLISKDDFISSDYVGHFCYAYASRASEDTKMLVFNESTTLMGEDYRLESDYGKIENWSGYECVLSDDITKMKLYKRINPAKLTPLTDTIIENVESKDLYIPLFDYFSDDYLNANSLKMVLECDAEVDQGNLSISLVQVLSDLEGKTIDYGSTVFDWYFGHRKHYKFHFVRKITNDFLADKSLNLYFYNPELIQLKINRIRIRIYSCEMQ